MNELKAGYRVLVDATITNVDIENGKYYVRVSDHGIWMKEDKVHSINTDAKTYEDGLREAWETAKKMFLYPHEGGYSSTELEEIFGRTEHLWELSPQDAAAKIAEWEKQKIHVGDVVKITLCGPEGVASRVAGEWCYVIFGDGSARKFKIEYITKTGRTIDIAGLLAQIGGAEQ